MDSNSNFNELLRSREASGRKSNVPSTFDFTNTSTSSRSSAQLDTGNHNSTVAVRVEIGARYSELGTLILKVLRERIVAVEHLTLGITLSLNRQLNQVLILRNTGDSYQSRSNTSIDASTGNPSSISTGHLHLHTLDLIEAIQGLEGDELRLIEEGRDGRRCGRHILAHVQVRIAEDILCDQGDYLLHLQVDLIAVLAGKWATDARDPEVLGDVLTTVVLPSPGDGVCLWHLFNYNLSILITSYLTFFITISDLLLSLSLSCRLL